MSICLGKEKGKKKLFSFPLLLLSFFFLFLMFKKPFHVKTRSPLKGSERKGLLEKIVTAFPLLATSPATAIPSSALVKPAEEPQEDGQPPVPAVSPSLVDYLLPKKGGVEVWKIQTHGDVLGRVFLAHGRPMFVETDRGLFPTVYALRMAPDAFPAILTNDYVLERLKDGADLMLPGITFVRKTQPGDFNVGDLRAVKMKVPANVEKCRDGWPVGVGNMLVSSADVASSSFFFFFLS